MWPRRRAAAWRRRARARGAARATEPQQKLKGSLKKVKRRAAPRLRAAAAAGGRCRGPNALLLRGDMLTIPHDSAAYRTSSS
jgi:hypothetical protein